MVDLNPACGSLFVPPSSSPYVGPRKVRALGISLQTAVQIPPHLRAHMISYIDGKTKLCIDHSACHSTSHSLSILSLSLLAQEQCIITFACHLHSHSQSQAKKVLPIHFKVRLSRAFSRSSAAASYIQSFKSA